MVIKYTYMLLWYRWIFFWFYFSYVIMYHLVTYFAVLISLCVLDYLRLWVILHDQIQQRLWHLMRPSLLRWPAIAFYIFYSLAILLLIIYPQAKLWSTMATVGLYGAILWCTVYMTYDFTNWATLKDRPSSMIIPDIARWTFVTAIVAMIGYTVWMKIV